MDGLTAGIDLPPTTRAPWAVRRLVLTLLSGWDLAAPTSDRAPSGNGELTTADVIELLANEVVTNAVEHVGGTTPIHVALRYAEGHLEVSVTDASPALPVVRRVSGAVRGGRGMFLVDALAERWGCEHVAGGKRVWFQVQMCSRIPTS